MQNCRADSNYLGTIRRHANPWVVAVSACSVDAASSRMSKCQRWSFQKKTIIDYDLEWPFIYMDIKFITKRIWHQNDVDVSWQNLCNYISGLHQMPRPQLAWSAKQNLAPLHAGYRSSRLQQPPKNWPVDLFLRRNVWCFFFFRKTQQDFPAISFCGTSKKGISNWATNQKKTSQKKTTESTHHSRPPRFSRPWAVPCDKFVKQSTENSYGKSTRTM